MDSCFKPQHHNHIAVNWKCSLPGIFWLAFDFGNRSGYAFIHNSVLYFGCFQFVGLDSTKIIATAKKARFSRLVIMSAHDMYGNLKIVRALSIKKGYVMGRLISVLPYQKKVEIWFFSQEESKKNSVKMLESIKAKTIGKNIHLCEHTQDALEIFSNAFKLTKNKVLPLKVRGILKR